MAAPGSGPRCASCTIERISKDHRSVLAADRPVYLQPAGLWDFVGKLLGRLPIVIPGPDKGCPIPPRRLKPARTAKGINEGGAKSLARIACGPKLKRVILARRPIVVPYNERRGSGVGPKADLRRQGFAAGNEVAVALPLALKRFKSVRKKWSVMV